MKDTHPIELMLVALIAACTAITWAIRTTLVPLVALVLTVAGWRPAAADPVVSAAPALEPIPAAPQVEPKPVITQPLTAEPVAPSGGALLPGLTVAQLRKQARAAGHTRAWCRTARKAELLEVLAVS